MENIVIRAAGYARVSTSVQVEEGESLTTQRKQITDYIELKKWKLTEIYSDEGLSGAKSDSRPALQKMIEDAKAGKMDVIVFTKLSRFCRNARDYMNLSYELEKYKVDLVSIKEGIDKSTQTGKLIAGILSLFAEFEKETIREQMYENKMARWKENRSFVGKPPFAYRWNKEKKLLEVVPEEAEIYRRIVNMYVQQGLPMRDIAIKLNSEGIKLKRTYFNSAVISYLLKNPAYYGAYTVNRHIYVDGKKGAGSKRSKDMKPDSEAITFPIPALISKPQWDAIQEATSRNKTHVKHSGEFTNSFLLRSVCQCEECGGKMNARIGNRRKDGSAPRYYNCYWAGTSKKNLEGRRQKCSLPNIPAEPLEREVWNRLMMLFSVNPKSVDKMFETENIEDKIASHEKAINNLQKDLQSKKVTRERLYRMLEMENVDLNELNQKLRENKDQILQLEGNITEEKAKHEELIDLSKKKEETKKFLHDNRQHIKMLQKELSQLSDTDKRILIENSLDGPVIVGYREPDEKHPEDGFGTVAQFRVKLNPGIIKRFIDEGKIHKLNTDSRDYLNIIYQLSDSMELSKFESNP